MAAAALAVAAMGLVRTMRLETAPLQLSESPYDDGPTRKALLELQAETVALSTRLDGYGAALAEGIERVDRSERRIRQTVSRARKDLEDEGAAHAGLEAEHAQLQLLDGGRGESGEVSVVPADVAEDLAQPRGIPGTFSQEVLKALRGR